MLRFSFEQLRAFVAVSETGSFSKAAKQIKKDRSTLHQQIGNLEIDLGIDLFDRSGKFPKITEEGRSLLTQAQCILYQAIQLQNCGDSLALGIEKCITIYHDISLPSSIIKQIQRDVYQQFPYSQINWLHRGRDEALHDIISEDVDLAIVLNEGNRLFPKEGIAFINLGQLPFACYVHKNNPLSNLVSCSFNDLAQHRQYICENYMQLDLGRELQISGNKAIISNVDIILSLLDEGGWSLLPQCIIEDSALKKDLKKLELSFAINGIRWAYSLVSLSLQSSGKVKSAAIHSIKEAFQAHGK
jgi:DNA-binding transcriptional LysR family regulator